MAMNNQKRKLPAALQQEVDGHVNAIENLTDEQRNVLRDMASAYVLDHPQQQPNYEGLARHVRSFVGR